MTLAATNLEPKDPRMGYLAVLLTVLFVALKLTGFIAWSWLWVLSPIAFIAILFVIAFTAVVAFLATTD